MRKRISGLMAFVCLLVAAASALAAGTTVTTFTPFADMDFAAQGYMDLITAWEDETGNMVEDYSGLEDDLFMEQMQEMVTAGRADLVVVPLGSGLTKDQLVSVDELLAPRPASSPRWRSATAAYYSRRCASTGKRCTSTPTCWRRTASPCRRITTN